MSTVPSEVTADQHAASDPAVSAWVSANAGSGKTHVLAQRVIRLLLDGTNPTKILCLTFTKAAAATMANRIFETLSAWIALDDAKLDGAIASTGAKPTGAKQRAQARRLFAAALETPGGLKVQTIHAFCTRLLQQFPFEANVPARFSVLEEAEQTQLLETIRHALLLEAARQPASAAGQALAAIIPLASDFAFETAITEVIRERAAVAGWLGQSGDLGKARDQLSAALGIDPSDTLASVENEIVEGPHLPTGRWASAAAVCAQSSSADRDQGVRLIEAAAAFGSVRIETYASIFLTEKGPRKTLVTAALAKSEPDLARRFSEEQKRVPALCEKWRAVLARDRTVALLTLGAQIIARYQAEKNGRGTLDYDDLISHTLALLNNVDSTWVHYKLDLGIDHLLIDEAQDTSPQQWDIIKRFVAEFTAGAGARGKLQRSIFAVGDDKQSIFSFQDAAPEAFDEMRHFFQTAHVNAGLPFLPIPFKYSFRSAPVVLDAVDDVFKQLAAHTGLTVDTSPTAHAAVRSAAPGLVELWPLVEPDNRDEVDPWDAPFDSTSETSPRVKLARQIARAVKTWLERGDLVGDDDKRHPVRPGDILVLVRQRGALFEAVIRAIKTVGIPVAGADRLVLTEHIAVMDLLVLADAILLPADDLAIATLLKSPLFGLSEQELFELARNRKGPLVAALRERRADVAAQFDKLAEAARQTSPFAFYAGLLGPQGARKAFVSRLGPEVNDALDEFLNLALDYERREASSLQGFVAWLRTASAEVKRDMELERDEVRVMTVHGAKGLEAPIVVLADTTTEPAGPAQYQPRLLALSQGKAPDAPACVVWMPRKKDDTTAAAQARSAAILAAENEYRRLLYVAMTRAADRLVVCGSVGECGAPGDCWYQLVEQGLEASSQLVEETADFGGTVRRYRKSPAATVTAPAETKALELRAPMPDWLDKDVAPAPPHSEPIKPSGYVDDPEVTDAVRSGQARQRAIARGNIVHRLMQSLPDLPTTNRGKAAHDHVARQATEFSEAERAAMAKSALALLDDPAFTTLFAPGSRAEVPIVGRIGRRLVNGVVDRLVITPADVYIADYKTNCPAPDSLAEAQARHAGYVKQLAHYRAVLARLYPGQTIRAALVWTDTARLMEIPAQALDAALAELTDP